MRPVSETIEPNQQVDGGQGLDPDGPGAGPICREAALMGKRQGHFCYLCGRVRPNEAFSGKGHRRHLCQECSRMPKEEREAIEQADEIYGFLKQSHISKKNIARLRILLESENPGIAEQADIVLQVALVKPHKKKRMGFLAHRHPELLRRMDETGLSHAHQY